jgi:hypothetical protein
MSITTASDYKSSLRQRILYSKTSTGWGGPNRYYSNLRIGGGSVAAASAPVNNTTGAILTSASTGFPPIADFGGAGYITEIEASMLSTNSAFGGYRWVLADILWYAGSYTGSSNVVLSSQPSLIARIPDGDYRGTQLWTIGTGGAGVNTPEVTITYTNEVGVTGRSTGLFNFNAAASSNVGLQAHLAPLQAGDLGIQKVESVVGNGSTTYQHDIAIVRPLVSGRVGFGRSVRRLWLDAIGMPVVYPTSALTTLVSLDSASPGTTVPMELAIEIASKLFTGTVSPAVTWNPSDKDFNTDLSNGNLTATSNNAGGGSTNGQVRATISRANGKFYHEIRLDAGPVSSFPYMGIRSIANALVGNGPFDAGGDFGCFMRSPNDGFVTYQPGSNIATVGPAVAVGDVFMFASDINNRKFWVGCNGTWTSGGNPSTGTGGATLTAGITWSPWVSNGTVAPILTARFASSDWTYPIPSGFEPWH